MSEMSVWDKMKLGFQTLVDDPDRTKRNIGGQADVATQAINEVLIPDGGEAARELARVLGLAWDELTDMEKQKLIAESLRNGQ